MTEKEAKTKWCPFARVGSTTTGLGGFNRFIEPVGAGSEDKVRCIGSACMAFRMKTWTEAIHTEPSATSIGIRYEHRSEAYCGLAGKP